MNTRKIVFIGMFAAIMCILSPIAVPMGAVPVTLSLFTVFLTALCLPGYHSVTATVIYILIGVIGLPVFSGFKGGVSVLFGATGGFLWSYPIMALIISYLKNKNQILAIITSIIVCYITGAIQLSFVTGVTLLSAFGTAFSFFPFDLLKMAVSLFVSKPLKKACASLDKLS